MRYSKSFVGIIISSSGNDWFEMLGETIRELDQGIHARDPPLLQCLAAQTSPAEYKSSFISHIAYEPTR